MVALHELFWILEYMTDWIFAWPLRTNFSDLKFIEMRLFICMGICMFQNLGHKLRCKNAFRLFLFEQI